jgi:competence protein ComEC
MRDVLVATVAAQIATLPIAVYAFGYFSVYALIANLLVVPLVPVTMLVTFVCGLIGLILPGIAFWFGLPLQWILEYMKWIINFLANLPGARNEVSFNIYLVMFSYAAIIGGTVYLLRVTKHDFRHDTELQHEF